MKGPQTGSRILPAWSDNLCFARPSIDTAYRKPLLPWVDAEIQVFRLGDLVLVGVPGEYFVELGLQIKEGIKEDGAKQVMICGFANGNVGYIPARRAYPKGGYEVAEAYKYYGYAAAIAPEGGEQIVDSARRLAAEL